jgi:hypothetical protein
VPIQDIHKAASSNQLLTALLRLHMNQLTREMIFLSDYQHYMF